MQGTDFKALQLAQQLLIRGEVDVQFMSDLEITRGTAKLSRQGLDRMLNRPPLTP